MSLLPHSYFRFLSLDREESWSKLISTLENKALPTSKITSFNDPFEAAPVLAETANRTINVTRNNYANTFWSQLRSCVVDEIRGRSLSLPEIINAFRENVRIVCFSRRVNSPLIWSHYCSGYKGLALHFAPSNMPDSCFHSHYFHWVEYQKQRPFVNESILEYFFDEGSRIDHKAFSLDVLGAIELQFMSSLFLWKSEDWSYEQEARIILPSKDVKASFFEGDLVSVIIGPRMSKDDEDRLRSIVAEKSPKTRVAKAALSRAIITLT